MPRIKPLTRDQAAPEARGFFDADQANWGRVLNSTGVYAYRPPILAASRAMTGAIAAGGRIDRHLTALLNLRVAELVRCPS